MDKETFTALGDFDIEAVEITGGTAHVRTMSNSDAEEYERNSIERSEKKDWCGFKAELLRLTLCTEAGALLFAGVDLVKALEDIGGKSRLSVEALFEAAQKVNGYDAETAEDDAKN
jgi:hypothetical protein